MSQQAMNKNTQAPAAKGASAPKTLRILPQQPVEAVNVVIKVTERLLDLSERETQALVHNDALKLDMIQDEKEILSGHYVTAAQEFRSRLGEFRRLDRNLIRKLETVQNELGEKMKQNTDLIEQMYMRSRRNTQATLFNAQEIGQDNKFFLREKEETEAANITPQLAEALPSQQGNAA